MKKKTYLLTSLMLILMGLSAQCDSTNRAYYITENNVAATVPNAGYLFYVNNNKPGISFPANTDIVSLFSSSYWFSGVDQNNTLKGNFQKYNGDVRMKDLYAGPISTTGTWKADCSFWSQAFRIDLDSINIFRNSSGATLPLQIKEWPAKGNPFLITKGITVYEAAAPFVDLNGDGIYNPTQGDFPKVKGDVSFFSIENDDSIHFNSNSIKMRIEIKKMLYLCKSNGIIANTIFYDLAITNKSPDNFHDCVFSVFADPDLGCSVDDLVGSDSLGNMAYVYNARVFDISGCTLLGLGNDSSLPIFGIKILKSYQNAGLTSFLSYSGYSGSDPSVTFDYRNYQLCKDKMGFDMSYKGRAAKHAYSGNPSKANEWSMCSDSLSGDDQRFVMNSYVGDFKKDSSISYSLAYFHVRPKGGVGLCPDRDVYITPYADSLQNFYDNNLLCQTFPLGLTAVEKSDNEVVLFPNPTQNKSFTIITTEQGDKTITLYNPMGQIILTKQISSSTSEINTESLTKGIYFVKVSLVKKEIIKKIVVQ